jgi:hypothetical protein
MFYVLVTNAAIEWLQHLEDTNSVPTGIIVETWGLIPLIMRSDEKITPNSVKVANKAVLQLSECLNAERLSFDAYNDKVIFTGNYITKKVKQKLYN